jgi:hypothetical protein
MEEVVVASQIILTFFPIGVLPEQIIARYQRHPYSGNSPLT